MWTTSNIRRHIYSLPNDQIFTTRHMLMYGTRAAVDQCMWRLVQCGEIDRLARGVFIRAGCERRPSLGEVKRIKAKSFARTIVPFRKEAAAEVGLIDEREFSMTSLSSGSTSSFRAYGYGRYHAHATSPRKMNLGKGNVAKVIKALWHVGGVDMEFSVVKDAIAKLKKRDWPKLFSIWHYMPHWMTDRILFYEADRIQNSIWARKNPAKP